MSTPRLSAPHLERLHQVLAGYIERKELPGLVALISHHDEVHLETLGTHSFTGATPMRRETIFRIASLSKPIVTAAAMILVEECRLRLDDSIEPWLPELANRRVLRSIASEPDDTVPATRAITLRDLLTYRMGFGMVLARPGTYPIQTLMREARVGGDGPPLPTTKPPADEWMRNLGAMPWMSQPGEGWHYHISGDVLGVLLARVSGQSLGDFLRDRLFDPLGMKDTSFRLPAEKVDRFPACYRFNRQTQTTDLFDDSYNSAWLSQPPFESAGGGLLSTIDDHLAFSRMMLNQGRHGSQQILSHASVVLMTTDHLTPQQRVENPLFFGADGGYRGWGFGMAVDLRRHNLCNTPGRFGWDGGFGTSAYTDPSEQMIGLLFTQRMMDSPIPPPVYSDFWTLAYAALR